MTGLLVLLPATAVAGCSGPFAQSNASTCAEQPFTETAGQRPVSLVNCAGVVLGLPAPDSPTMSVTVGSSIDVNGLNPGAYSDPRSSNPAVVAVTGTAAHSSTLKAAQTGTAVISIATSYCQSNQVDGHCPALTITVH